MSTQWHVAVLVGSLRKGSYTRMIANELIAVAPDSLAFEMAEIGNLPLYNQDLDDEKTPPAEWLAFRDRIRPMDAVLFATPEYNRSVPGVLKNALDVGSRPYGQNVWDKKPAAVVSVSPGAIGGFGANHHLRQSLVFVNMPVLQQPEAYISNVAKLLDANGKLTSDTTRQFMRTIVDAFAAWVERNAPSPAHA
ncbi:MAG TPA: NAD(P)H-dependent oxidoreductase [Gemmatimonadaceae bacterium]